MLLIRPLSLFKRKKILLVTHAGADVDALCAAGALFLYLKKNNSVKILVPDHIALPAKAVAKSLHIPYRIGFGPIPKGIDALFLVDFNDLAMAGSLKNEIAGFGGEIFLIDHHQPAKKRIAKAKNSLVSPKAVASCELVFDWIKKSGLRLEGRPAACIAAGIVTDSAYFLTANSRTFSIMSEALEKSGKTFSTITRLFSVKPGFDEKIAKLKAAKRARIFLVSGYIVATSDVGAFEADSASALVKIGADIAFVGDVDEGKLRISGRASQRLVKKSGFSLANHVFQKLPEFFPGSGGGHAGAAGFNGKGKDINQALAKCLVLTKQFFRKRKGYRFKEYT